MVESSSEDALTEELKRRAEPDRRRVLAYAMRMAHDLNNALSVAAMNVHILLMDTGDGDPRKKLLEEVAAAVRRASRLVGDLSRFAESSERAADEGGDDGRAADVP